MIILHKAGIDEDAVFVSLCEDEGKGRSMTPSWYIPLMRSTHG